MSVEIPRSAGPRRRRAPVLLAVLASVVALLTLGPGSASGLTGSTRAAGGATVLPAAAPRTHRFEVGVVGGGDPATFGPVAALGARVVRGEFTADTTVDELRGVVGGLAARGIRLQPLVGWEDGTEAPDLTPLARWAAAFGPGGSFWRGRSDATAMTDIELGNENAFGYKSGEATEPRYGELATAYGHRAVAAARAVHAANPSVGVMVELESGDTQSSAWIDDTLAAGGPDLVRLMHAPVIHAYGPDWHRKLDRDHRFLARHGVHRPFAMTEWGISTDDGVDLTDNYDWPTDLSYARAGALLTTALRQMATIPGELEQVMLFQLHDQRDPGTDDDREHYFGLEKLDGSPKGAFTAAAKNAYRMYP